MRTNISNAIVVGLIILLIIGVGYWVFAPGLTGAFVFDDVVNLQPIGQFGGVTNLPTFLAFITSGSYFPGRPLSLLSFLLDGQNWPLVPEVLKLTNLKFHLIAGLLVFWLTWLLSIYTSFEKPNLHTSRIWFSGFVTILWLLNPFQVSTVSYIIQRMTILSAIFVLAGLIGFVKGRLLLNHNPKSGILLCSFSIAFFGIASILSKENGILICAFALLLEWLVLSKEKLNTEVEPLWRWWKRIFLWFPLLLLVLYFLYKYRFFTIGYGGRTFTLSERILTEPRILFDYLGGIFFPSLNGMGLFSFSQPVSTGLFRPMTTVFSILGLFLIIYGAIKIRHKMPFVTLGILFYFTGHLIESTVIPLELYFEHRNYLPQFGLWLAFSFALLSLVQTFPRYKKITFILCGVLVMTYAGVTYIRSQLWGNTLLMSKVWYEQAPSVRTAQLFSSQLADKGLISEARSVLTKTSAIDPNSVALRFSQAIIDCRLTHKGFNGELYAKLALHAPIETAVQEGMQIFSDELVNGQQCKGLTESILKKIAKNYTLNPYYLHSPSLLSSFYIYLFDLSVRDKNIGQAVYYLDQACQYYCTARTRYNQALLMTTIGRYKVASQYLEKAELLRSPYRNLKDPFISQQIARLRSEMQKDIKKVVYE